ncbi:hypothetical protein ACFQ44_04385 [Levilactobacillus lanxiensis]|uniref:S-layer protein n=1 Tax=Levilactobacillus lanxiensis TaxID=2799568 RepID=A0ABW4D088_9LACO|nr:hypothetical protein [Levilactobacillus lanxiensis]
MQSSLAKSLYIGLAALSFGAVATVSTTANAASKAKVTSSQTLKTAADTRNVEVTGTNALYSKPGTVKGAKVVASKNTMKSLAASKKSAAYFRAYYQKTTNKGSVYYKIVSMDGKYRGYIYGGKTAGTFAGGIASANTTTKATMPANTTVYFTKPGKTNVTWDAPKYTQYKASKQIKDTTAYASDPLTVTDAVTKTREGSTYYYVTDAKNPAINGWIFAGAVTAGKSDAAKAENGITFNYINKATGAKVSSAIYEFPAGAATITNTEAQKQAGVAGVLPAGYSLATQGVLGSSDATFAKNSSVSVYVVANPAAALTVNPVAYNNDTNFTGNITFPADVQTKLAADTFFNQPKGVVASSADIQAHLTSAGADKFVVATNAGNQATGTQNAYQFTLKSVQSGTFGSSVNAFYEITPGTVSNSTSTFTPSK